MGFNVGLWLVQGLLALLFLVAGGMKLVLPLEALTGPILLPGLFIQMMNPKAMPFDVKRMAYGGFRVLIDA
jgi:hypothetical protein